MNQYKIWRTKPDAHLDYDTDRPRQKTSAKQTTADPRVSSRADGKHHQSSRGYVSEGHISSRPPAHYSTVPSSSKASRSANPPSSTQYPPSSSQYPTTSSHKLPQSTNAVPTTSSQRYPEAVPGARAHHQRSATTDRIMPSVEKARVADDFGRSSRQRLPNPGQAPPTSGAVPFTSQTPGWTFPPQEPRKSSSRHQQSGTDGRQEAEKAEKAREKEMRREERRREEQRQGELRQEEARLEEEKRKQKEERRREREERRKAEERFQEQKAREERRRAESSRAVEDPSQGVSHMQPVAKESRHGRIRESDESDGSLRKPVSTRHRSHHKEHSLPVNIGIITTGQQNISQTSIPVAHHPENTSANHGRKHITPLQTSAAQSGQPAERTKHSKRSRSQGETVPYPPGYAVNESQPAPRTEQRSHKYDTVRSLGQIAETSTSRSTTVPTQGALASQQKAATVGRSSRTHESSRNGLPWPFHRSEASPASKQDKQDSAPAPAPPRAVHSNPSPIISIRAGQGPSDSHLPEQTVKQRAHPRPSVSGDANKHSPPEHTYQSSLRPNPVESHVQEPPRPPSTQPNYPYARSTLPVGQWSGNAGSSRATRPHPNQEEEQILMVPSAAILPVRSQSYDHQAEPARSPAPAPSQVTAAAGRSFTPAPPPFTPAPVPSRTPSHDRDMWGATTTSGSQPGPSQYMSSYAAPQSVQTPRQAPSPQAFPNHFAGAPWSNSTAQNSMAQPYHASDASPPKHSPLGAAATYHTHDTNSRPIAPYSDPSPAVPDLASRFPFREDVVEPTTAYQADFGTASKDRHGRQDTQYNQTPVPNPSYPAYGVTFQTPKPAKVSPGQGSRTTPHNTPPKDPVPPVVQHSQPTPGPSPQSLPRSTNDYPYAHDPSQTNVSQAMFYNPTPSTYPATPVYPSSSQTHVDATHAPNIANVANPNSIGHQQHRSTATNPSPRSQTFPVAPPVAATPAITRVTSRTPSHDTGSTTLLGHTPSSQGSILMPPVSPAVYGYTVSNPPTSHSAQQPGVSAPFNGPSYIQPISRSAPPSTPAPRQTNIRHHAYVPSPTIPSTTTPVPPPPAPTRSQSQPSQPRATASTVPARSYSQTQIAPDPVSAPRYANVPVASSSYAPRTLVPSPSPEPEILMTPSSIARSPMKLPASPAPVVQTSSQSYQEQKKKGGLLSALGLRRSKTTSRQPQPPSPPQLKPVVSREAQSSVPAKVVTSEKSTPFPVDPRSKVATTSSRHGMAAPVAVPIPGHHSRERKTSGSYGFGPFRLLSKRHRTVSAASAEAVDGTNAASTIITSPAGSTRSPTPGLPPPQRDPVQAAVDWRNQEEEKARHRGGARRRRPGVTFEGYESDHPQAEQHKQGYVARMRIR